MNVSLIVTVKNEVNNIDTFINSIISQNTQPNEIIITVASSDDGTLEKIYNWEKILSNLKIISIGESNRSIGRNRAISAAKGEIIACTDSGCVLSHDWIGEITKPFIDPKIDIVSGFFITDKKDYMSIAIGFFTHPTLQEIDEKSFIPSARSMSFKKNVWKKSKFPENYSFNEDTVYGRRLRRDGYNFYFNPNAKVIWNPESKINDFVRKFFSYGRGDAESGENTRIYFKKFFFYIIFMLIILASYFSLYLTELTALYILFFIVKLSFKAYKKTSCFVSSLIIIFYKPIVDFSFMSGFIFGKCQSKIKTSGNI